MVRRRCARWGGVLVGVAAAVGVLEWARPRAPVTFLVARGPGPQPIPDPVGQRLLDWLQEEGATVHENLRVAVLPPLGRELVTAGPVAEGSPLVRLPPELCIATPVADDQAQEVALPEDVRLAARILEEVEGNPRWESYCKTWPPLEDLVERMPVFWDHHRLQQASQTMPSLEEQVQSRRKLVEAASVRLRLPVARLMWAHAVVSTRAVGAGMNACALVPGVDLANHDTHQNAELMVAGQPGIPTGRATVSRYRDVWSHGTAGLVALRDLRAGEAVRISYGRYPNQRFLLDYGFTLPSNPAGELEARPAAPTAGEGDPWQRRD